MWKKDDKVGSKSGYKRKLLLREKEESKKKNWKAQKQKKYWLITSTDNYACWKLFFSHSNANWPRNGWR